MLGPLETLMEHKQGKVLDKSDLDNTTHLSHEPKFFIIDIQPEWICVMFQWTNIGNEYLDNSMYILKRISFFYLPSHAQS